MAKNFFTETGTQFKWVKSQDRILKDLGFNKQFFLFAAENFGRRMDKYVPMDTGMLAQTYTTSSDENSGTVEYNQPYAKKMYYGENLNFNTEKHELATSHWDKAMYTSEKEQIVKELDLVRKRLSI